MLIVDLEAACDEFDRLPATEIEFIEVGAVWATVDGTVVNTFDSLVKPSANAMPILHRLLLRLWVCFRRLSIWD
jgi:inhibitor of KinA sporulation pathway (predicted exonuclease)